MNCWRFSAATVSDDAHQPLEIVMTTQAKLTETQTTILKTAAGRADGNIEPLPANLLGGFEPWNCGYQPATAPASLSLTTY